MALVFKFLGNGEISGFLHYWNDYVGVLRFKVLVLGKI
jgi:hypothetical protein